MKAQNTNVKVLIGGSAASPGDADLAAFKADGTAGEIFASDGTGSAFAVTSTQLILSVKNADGTLQQTEVIPVAGIVKAKALAYAAGTNQVDFIGFNGTTGSIDAVNSTHSIVNLRMQEFGSMSAANYENLVGEFYTDSTATQQEVADGMVSSLIASHDELDQERFLIERVIDVAGGIVPTGVNTLTFTKGSKYFTATDINNASGAAAFQVGEYIRVGTNLTDPIYKIAAINALTNVGTLDVAFQGDTTSVDDTACKRIATSALAAAAFGIKLTARDLTAVAGKFPVQKFHFSTSLENFGSTTLTAQSTGASVGTGSGAQVREHEWFARGNFGEIYRTGQPYLFDNELLAAVGSNYDALCIDYYLDERERLTYTSSPRSVVVYGVTNGTNDVIDGLVADIKINTVSSVLNGLDVISA